YDTTRDDFKRQYSYFPAVPKPIIAAVNGACAGLGMVIALYADIRFAADTAVFTTAFSRRGLIAEHGISWLLPRIVGMANAADLLFSARKLGAAEALAMGLVNRVIPLPQFEGEAIDAANADMRRSFSSADFKEGVAHFVEKRAPAFTGG